MAVRRPDPTPLQQFEQAAAAQLEAAVNAQKAYEDWKAVEERSDQLLADLKGRGEGE
ncbi:hypothetical protein [Streptomyces chrestomyceticus]|uniref:hypothetical protein n=1 Tax=Streptomyces chrestomyceticus TaxID=68185 RepID=UPI0033CB4EEE